MSNLRVPAFARWIFSIFKSAISSPLRKMQPDHWKSPWRELENTKPDRDLTEAKRPSRSLAKSIANACQPNSGRCTCLVLPATSWIRGGVEYSAARLCRRRFVLSAGVLECDLRALSSFCASSALQLGRKPSNGQGELGRFARRAAICRGQDQTAFQAALKMSRLTNMATCI